MPNVLVKLKKAGQLLSRYPNEPGVHPQTFEGLSRNHTNSVEDSLLSFQCVSDKFYFLLFGAIRERIETKLRVRVELVVVRAINGAVGSSLLAHLKRSAPIAWLLSRQWERAYGSHVDAVAYRCVTWAQPFADLFDWWKAGSYWRTLTLQQKGFSLKIDGIEVADLIVDSYLRYKPSPEFDVKDPFVRRLVWQAFRDTRKARDYFGSVNPRWYLTSYSTYLEHGIPVRVALSLGVDVWSFGNLSHFVKKLSVVDTCHTPNYASYWKVFQSLDQQDIRLQAARLQLENRLAGTIDDATSYMRQSAYAQADTKLPEGLRGAAVIFLHDFYDSPHLYPDLIFEDFWEWVCTSVEIMQNAGINFFLKPHPNQIPLSDQALIRLRKKYTDLQWISTETSNVLLVQAGIACGITIYGTVAHELAYLGVPSIGCARHPHQAFHFCRTASTREEYKDLLLTYAKLPLSREEMQRQALAFYYIHNIYGDEEFKVLRKALLAFWKLCHQDGVTDVEVTKHYRAIKDLPSFDRLIEIMINQSEDNMMCLDAAMKGE